MIGRWRTPLLITVLLGAIMAIALGWSPTQASGDRFHNPLQDGSEVCSINVLGDQEFIQPFYTATATQILTVSLWATRVGITPTVKISIHPLETDQAAIASSAVTIPRSIDPVTIGMPADLAPGQYMLALQVTADETSNLQIDADCLKRFHYPGYVKSGDTTIEMLPLFFKFDSEAWPGWAPRFYLPQIFAKN